MQPKSPTWRHLVRMPSQYILTKAFILTLTLILILASQEIFDDFLKWYEDKRREEYVLHGYPFVKGSKHVVTRPGYEWIRNDPSIKETISFN